MTPELKQKWVEALRSGKYQQTKQWLRDDKGFCCLGVLADICGAKWSESGGWEHPQVDGVRVDFTASWSSGGKLLSDDFVKKHGLQSQSKLSELNDTGKSFNEIADYIEANY